MIGTTFEELNNDRPLQRYNYIYYGENCKAVASIKQGGQSPPLNFEYSYGTELQMHLSYSVNI